MREKTHENALEIPSMRGEAIPRVESWLKKEGVEVLVGEGVGLRVGLGLGVPRGLNVVVGLGFTEGVGCGGVGDGVEDTIPHFAGSLIFASSSVSFVIT